MKQVSAFCLMEDDHIIRTIVTKFWRIDWVHWLHASALDHIWLGMLLKLTFGLSSEANRWTNHPFTTQICNGESRNSPRVSANKIYSRIKRNISTLGCSFINMLLWKTSVWLTLFGRLFFSSTASFSFGLSDTSIGPLFVLVQSFHMQLTLVECPLSRANNL